MRCNNSKLVVMVIFVVLAVGCQSKGPPPSSSTAEELRLLTPEQEKKLLENADRVEKKEIERQPLKNQKGEVIGTITSQTTIIFLKPGFGGGKFSVSSQCVSACTGAVDAKGCGCNDTCTACTGTPTILSSVGGADNTCHGTCTMTKSGFGNFGIFIAMNRDDPPHTSVAHR